VTVLRCHAVSPALGAVVEGVRLSPELDDTTVAGIRGALLRHKVVWFRGQSLDAAALTAVATRFGTPTEAHPVEPSLEGHPEVLPLDSEEGARADVWHSDLTFQERPPAGAILHALEVPPVGGDTLWADLSGAYLSLSSRLRAFVDGLTATHSPAKAGGYFAQRDATGGEAGTRVAMTATSHPVV
jgi:alpha-ketoglutarate-dependent sulfate ester dioxygenase